jgi:ParB-like chromosome segregation protein Spo0J
MLAPTAEPINYYALEYHPSANLFPMIEGEEFERLVESIKEKGLLTPITLHRDGGA